MNISYNEILMPLFADFDIKLMFLIIFLSDMHLSDFLMNVIFCASRNDKKTSN